MVVTGADKATDPISIGIEKFFRFFHIDYTLNFLLVFICVLFILRAITLLVTNYIRISIETDYERTTRTELFRKTFAAGWPYLLGQKIGHLNTLLVTNITFGEIFLGRLSNVLMVIVTLTVYIFVAVNISFLITLATLTLGFMLTLGLRPLISRTRRLTNEVESNNRSIAHLVNENMLGMKVIKSMLAQNAIVTQGSELFDRQRFLRIRVAMLRVFPDSVMEPVSVIFIVIIFATTYHTPGFNPAALAAVVYLIQRIFTYTRQLQGHLLILTESMPYVEQIIRYERELKAHEEEDVGHEPLVFDKELSFKNIAFAYDQEGKQGEREILRDVSFSVKHGEMVGIIGPSGAGKTTIVDLVLRLFAPTGGTITIDGKDIRHIRLAEWRRHIGYVSQDMFLINDTFANNITFYNETVTREDTIEAAKKANIYDFIMSAPRGFDTVIGERGVQISAGQRQRLVIARILATKPKLLILDEATSALDNESELLIQKVIENLKGTLTVIIVAHRLSTLTNTNRIIVLNDGHIVEQGTPHSLMENPSSYFSKMINMRKQN
jgi:ABC-type multidrug transport system fused ATPase/permease subunit